MNEKDKKLERGEDLLKIFNLNSIDDIYKTIKIESCNFNESISTVLVKNNISTLYDLMKCNFYDISVNWNYSKASIYIYEIDKICSRYGIINCSELSGEQYIDIELREFKELYKELNRCGKIYENRKCNNSKLHIDSIYDLKLISLYQSIFFNRNVKIPGSKKSNYRNIYIPDDYIETINYIINDISDNKLKYSLFFILGKEYGYGDFPDSVIDDILCTIRNKYYYILLLGKEKYSNIDWTRTNIVDSKINDIIEKYNLENVLSICRSINLTIAFKYYYYNDISSYLKRFQIKTLYDLIISEDVKNSFFSDLDIMRDAVHILGDLSNIGIYLSNNKEIILFQNIDTDQYNMLCNLLKVCEVKKGMLSESISYIKEKEVLEDKLNKDELRKKVSLKMAEDRVYNLINNSNLLAFDINIPEDILKVFPKEIISEFNIKTLRDLYNFGPKNLLLKLNMEECNKIFSVLKKYGIFVSYNIKERHEYVNGKNVIAFNGYWIPYNNKDGLYKSYLHMLKNGVLDIDTFFEKIGLDKNEYKMYDIDIYKEKRNVISDLIVEYRIDYINNIHRNNVIAYLKTTIFNKIYSDKIKNEKLMKGCD